MPTFTAIAFDRLIEPGASKTARKSAPTSMPVPNPKKLERRGSEPAPEKKAPSRPQLKPALYATPEVTPLPDSPSSFPPSPYIINHKRRGPRLLKSFSEANVQATQKVHDNEHVNCKSSETVVASSAGDLQVPVKNPEPVKGEQVNGVHDGKLSSSNGGNLENGHKESGMSSVTSGLHMEKEVALNSERDGEGEDFFDDPQESMSLTSYTDGEDVTGTERNVKLDTSGGEFFDAWEGKLG